MLKLKEIKLEHSPWISTGQFINLNCFFIKNVLSEKFYFQNSRLIEANNFIEKEIDGSELMFHKDCKFAIFYAKNNQILIEQDTKWKNIHVSSDLLKKLNDNYKFHHIIIKKIFKNFFESNLIVKKNEYEIAVNPPLFSKTKT